MFLFMNDKLVILPRYKCLGNQMRREAVAEFNAVLSSEEFAATLQRIEWLHPRVDVQGFIFNRRADYARGLVPLPTAVEFAAEVNKILDAGLEP